MDNRLIFLYSSVGATEGRSRLGWLPTGSGSPSVQGGREANPPVNASGVMGRGVLGQSESADARLPRKAPKR